MYENCKTVDELIEAIFSNVLSVKYSKEENNSEIFGFYASLPKLTPLQLVNSRQEVRLFYNASTKLGKIFGETNKSDKENQISESYLYVFEALRSVFSGEANVNEELKCESIDDCIRILNDDRLCANLCKWCITYIDMKTKTLMKQKSNPDYFYNGRDYSPIAYKYLDDYNSEDDMNPYEVLKLEQFESKIGDLTSYILDTYFEKLTSKQKIFVKCFIEFGQTSSGHIEDMEGHVLYIPQEFQNYKNAIKKRLWKYIENDNHIEIKNGRMIYRD